MRALRIAAISLLAVITAAGAIDRTDRHCRRATSGRSMRGRTDQDRLAAFGGHIVEDSVGLGWADLERTGGQLELSAERPVAGLTARPVFVALGMVSRQADALPEARVRIVPTSRGPPLFLS